MSLFFAINPSGYVSESREYTLQIQHDRRVWIDHLDTENGRLLSRNVAPDLFTAAQAVTIREHGYKEVSIRGA